MFTEWKSEKTIPQYYLLDKNQWNTWKRLKQMAWAKQFALYITAVDARTNQKVAWGESLMDFRNLVLESFMPSISEVERNKWCKIS